ncbi:MAG: ABC transporter permease [Chloroflexota bacterium]
MRFSAPSKETGYRALRIVIFYIAVIGVWWAIARAEIWSPYLFPAPDAVFKALRTNLENGQIPAAVLASLQRMAIGYVVSFVLGMLLGILIASSKWANETVGGVVLGVQSLPSITWLPLAVLWFGLSEQAIIFVVLMGSTFSIAISARAGILGIPPLLQRAAGTLGASRWQAYLYVVLPGMIPAMVQGMKQGWSFAWRSLMAGELLFVSAGLGHLLDVGRNLNNIAMVFSVMFVIVIVGVAVDRLIFGRAERWVQERWGYAA